MKTKYRIFQIPIGRKNRGTSPASRSEVEELSKDRMSFAGRAAYFIALHKYYPEMLDSLLSDVLPAFEPKPQIFRKRRWSVLESWREIESGQERKALHSALKTWAAHYRITEVWILDAALDTLSVRARKLPGQGWQYYPVDFITTFAPKLRDNAWWPPEFGGQEHWDAFRHRIEAQFSTQLSQYRKRVNAVFAVNSNQTDRNAEWTARWQKGDSAAEIAETSDLHRYKDPAQTVYRRIEEFAGSIDLKLRRRGERIKPIT